MAGMASSRLLCLLSFSMGMSRASSAAASAPPLPLPEPHLPHLPHKVDSGGGGPPYNYSMNSKIIISALGILFFIVFTIVLLHVYAKWCWWRRAHIQQRMLAQLHGSASLALARHPDSAKPCGLDKEVVAALPTFAFKPHLLRKPAECAVCLAEFRPGDACKLLPPCHHSFHTRCIDAWFTSNATCPLCRATPGLLLVDDEEAAAAPPLHPPPGAGEASAAPCPEAQAELWCKLEDEKDGQDDRVLLQSAGISSQARRWRRSLSDKLLGAGNRDPVAMGDHAAPLPSCPPLVWERSASYSTIDSLRDVESSHVEFSSCSCVSGLVSPRPVCHHHPPHHRPHAYHSPLAGPKSLARVFSK